MASNISINTTALGIPWVSGEVYRVVIDDGFVNQDGGLRIPVAGGQLTTFTTSAFPPQIGNTVPTHTSTAPIGIQDISFGIDRANLSILGGNVTLNLQSSPNVVVKTITVSNIAGQGNVVAMNIVGNLLASQTYFVSLTANIFQDKDGFRNNAVTNSSSFRFVSPSAPSAYDSIPSNNTTAEKGFEKIDIIFDRIVTVNAGNIYVYKANTNTLVITASLTSANIGNSLIYAGGQYLSNASVNVVGVMEANEKYYVRANANIVQDSTLIKSNFSGNIFTFTSPIAPQLLSTSPANASVLSIGQTTANLTFDRPIFYNTGNIYLFLANSNQLLRTYNSSNISIVGNIASLSLSNSSLEANKKYYFTSNANVVHDATRLKFAGITTANTYNFFSPTDPQVIAYQPSDFSVPAEKGFQSILITYDRNITINSGNIYLYTYPDGTLISTINSNSNIIANSANTISANIVGLVQANQQYYTRHSANLVYDNLQINTLATGNVMYFLTPTAPNISSVVPTNNSTITLPDITITFDRNISAYQGNLYLFDNTNTLIKQYAVQSNTIISGSELNLSVYKQILGNKTYYITGNANIVQDNTLIKSNLSGNIVSFTTPNNRSIISTNPISGNLSVIENQTVNLTISGTSIERGTGNVYIYKSDNTLVNTYLNSNLSVANNAGNANVSINISGKLDANQDYYILANSGILVDNLGIDSNGLSSNTDFTFRTSIIFNRDWPNSFILGTSNLITGTSYSGNTYIFRVFGTNNITNMSSSSSLGGTFDVYRGTSDGSNNSLTSLKEGYQGALGFYQPGVPPYYGGGGGGAGGAGVVQSSGILGAAGPGLESSITGNVVIYGGGGSGKGTAANGTPYSGNGGASAGSGTTAGNGGSGIVILKFLEDQTSPMAITAPGANVTVQDVNYLGIGNLLVYKFTSNSYFSLNAATSTDIEYLIVGGGGGGGGYNATYNSHGGGGGGGGVKKGFYENFNGNTIITVGNGGTSGTTTSRGGDGGNSSVFGITVRGGGGGGSPGATSFGNATVGTGRAGASGGGGATFQYEGGVSNGVTYVPSPITLAVIQGNLQQINGHLSNLSISYRSNLLSPYSLKYKLKNGLNEINYKTINSSGVTSYNSLGGSDVNFSNVQLLLSGGGTDGGTSISDSSNNNYSLTSTGTAPSYSSTRSKWTTTSINFSGGGGLNLEATSVSNLNLNNDYTIEMWVYPTSASGALIGANLYGRILLFVDLYCEMGNGISTLIGSSYASAACDQNAWNHIAVTRASNTVRVFKNGTQVSSFAVSGTADQAKDVEIGHFAGAGNYMTGQMEDFRWTKDVARYTTNFTPPANRFSR